MSNCSIKNCIGKYENKTIAHTVRIDDQLVIIDNVPVEECDVCGDVLFSPDTIRHIETIIKEHKEPIRTAPIYEYA